MSPEKRDTTLQQAKLPQEFIELAEASIGRGALAVYLNHFNTIVGEKQENSASSGAVTSIRLNPAKTGINANPPQNLNASNSADPLQNGRTAIPSGFESLLENAEPVPWCSTGFYLPERPQFTLDPLIHCGAYYVQEASSMFAQTVFDTIKSIDREFATTPLRVLDLCAAPGGKSTHIASLLNEDSLLVSNEVIKSRVVILADNLAKWGAENVVVTNNDPKDFSRIKEWFNIIFVDAPCSGEGMFIKDPAAIKEWSPANVDLCASRQKRILQDIWGSLQEGGYLVYSTCTFNHFENDGNLEYIVEELGAEVVEMVFPTLSCPNSSTPSAKPQIIKTPAGGYQFVPGMVKGEGQFVAVVRKVSGREDEENFRENHGGHNVFSKGKKEKGGTKTKGSAGNTVKGFNWLSCNEYDFTMQGELVKAHPKRLANDIKFIEQNLKVVSSGIAAATIKGKDFIPHADLALTQNLTKRVVATQLTTDSTSTEQQPDEVGQMSVEDGKNSRAAATKECSDLPFPTVELSREEALAFLSKEPLTFENSPNGYLLLTYKGIPLGFVKNLGNRSNNLWPQARRIRMAH